MTGTPGASSETAARAMSDASGLLRERAAGTGRAVLRYSMGSPGRPVLIDASFRLAAGAPVVACDIAAARLAWEREAASRPGTDLVFVSPRSLPFSPALSSPGTVLAVHADAFPRDAGPLADAMAAAADGAQTALLAQHEETALLSADLLARFLPLAGDPIRLRLRPLPF